MAAAPADIGENELYGEPVNLDVYAPSMETAEVRGLLRAVCEALDVTDTANPDLILSRVMDVQESATRTASASPKEVFREINNRLTPLHYSFCYRFEDLDGGNEGKMLMFLISAVCQFCPKRVLPHNVTVQTVSPQGFLMPHPFKLTFSESEMGEVSARIVTLQGSMGDIVVTEDRPMYVGRKADKLTNAAREDDEKEPHFYNVTPDEKTVSSYHMKIFARKRQLLCRSHASNPFVMTEANGRRYEIYPGSTVPLTPECEIAFGDRVIKVSEMAGCPYQPHYPPDVSILPTPPPGYEDTLMRGDYEIEVVRGEDEGLKWIWRRSRMSLSMGCLAAKSELVLNDPANALSRRHCTIWFDKANECLVITDSSGAGTFLSNDGTGDVPNMDLAAGEWTPIDKGATVPLDVPVYIRLGGDYVLYMNAFEG